MKKHLFCSIPTFILVNHQLYPPLVFGLTQVDKILTCHCLDTIIYTTLDVHLTDITEIWKVKRQILLIESEL